MMNTLRRYSPVSFAKKTIQTERRDGWEVVLAYEDEGDAPYLVDLSHIKKWDVQDSDLSAIQPWGLQIPELPGSCLFERGILINRMNRTQAACWHLIGDHVGQTDMAAFTETTDAHLLLAIVGRELFAMMEKVCGLDFGSPKMHYPCLFQAPVLRVPCQIVLLGQSNNVFAMLLACSRGYGYSMVEGLLHAGDEWGLHPAGERAFTNWMGMVKIH